MASFFISFMAFCYLVPIQINNTNARSAFGLASRKMDFPSENTPKKSANKHGTVEKRNEKQNTEINQFVHELFDQYSKIVSVLYKSGQAKAIDYSMIEAVLYGDSQSSAEAIKKQRSNSNVDGLVDGINKINLPKSERDEKNESAALMDEFEILKTIDQLDKPIANLLKKLHNSISDLMESVNGGKNDLQNAKLQNMKTIIMEAVMKLAQLWGIPLIEIKQMENEQNIDQKSILKELAKFWHKFKRQKGQNEKKKSDQKRKDDQQNKRILKLIMDLSIDGIDGLANLKGGAKKRENRRRRKRKRDGYGTTIGILVSVVVLLMAFSVFHCRKSISSCINRNGNRHRSRANIENPNSPAEESQRQMAPEGREDPNSLPRSFSTQSQEGLLRQPDYDADQDRHERNRTRRERKKGHTSNRAPDVGSQMHYAQEYYQRPAHRSEAPTRSDYDADAEPRPRSRSGRANSKERRRRISTPRRKTSNTNTRRSNNSTPHEHTNTQSTAAEGTTRNEPQQQSAYIPHVAVDVNSSGIQHDGNWQDFDPRAWDQPSGYASVYVPPGEPLVDYGHYQQQHNTDGNDGRGGQPGWWWG